MKHLRILALFVALFSLSACSISLSNSRVRDGGVFRSSDYGQHWEQKVFVGQSGRQVVTISDVDPSGIVFSPFSPTELLLPTIGSGVYVTTNSGDQWQRMTLPVAGYTAIAYDPTNPALLYAATGRTILKSSDSGATWDTVYTDARSELITALAVDHYDPSKIIAATNSGTILKSINYGNDWATKFSALDPARSLFFRADDTRIVYLVTSSKGLVRSSDNGETWTSLLESVKEYPGAGTVYQVTFSPNAPGILYQATNYGILRSDTGGDAWTPIKTLVPNNTLPVRTVAVDPQNSLILYFSVNNLLHKTEDGGLTWRTIETIPTGRLITRLVAHPTTPGLLFLGTFKVKK